MKYGYLRVSTNTQDETRQREALKKYGFSTTQTDLIIRTLEITGVTE